MPANVDDDRADDSVDDDDDLLDIIQANDRRRLKLYESQNQSAAPSSGGGAGKPKTGDAAADKQSTRAVKRSVKPGSDVGAGDSTKPAVSTVATTAAGKAEKRSKKKDGVKNRTAIDRHIADNERRLESLKERSKHSQQQSSLIKAALASVVRAGNSVHSCSTLSHVITQNMHVYRTRTRVWLCSHVEQ